LPLLTALESFVEQCHILSMTDKPKRPRDANQLAKRIADIATGETEDKQPLASAQKGGLKGGPLRAKILTPKQRSEIARTAAEARWKKT
jgi:hypothetical protein